MWGSEAGPVPGDELVTCDVCYDTGFGRLWELKRDGWVFHDFDYGPGLIICGDCDAEMEARREFRKLHSTVKA